MMRRIDLLPPAYAQRKRERNALLMVGIGAAVAVLLLLGWWFWLGMQINDAETELARIQQTNADLEADIAELQRFVDLQNEVDAKRTALQTVMQGDVDWPGVLAEIAMVLPGETWLTNLNGSAGITEGFTEVPTETSPIPVAADETFGRIQFEGVSLTMPGVAKWMLRMEGVDSFFATYLQSATLEESEDEQETVVFQASIELGDKAASGRFQQRLDE